MIRFHVVDDQIIDFTVADDAADFLDINFKESDIYRIHQCHHIVICNQIGVIRYAIRKWPQILKQCFCAVVHTDIMNFTFNFH